MTPIALDLRHIRKTYRVYRRPQDRLLQMLQRAPRYTEFHALRGVDLTVQRGETVGLVGRNGSGKSTLLQIICGTLAPSSGEVETRGRISALLELGAGFNPEFSGRENIFLNAAILGLSKEETRARYDDIVAFSGLDAPHLEQPVKTYSSGMAVRLAFAVAVAVEPDLLVIDEALAVGDEGFQRKCFARLAEMQRRGVTILLVSHAAQAIVDLCDRALLVDAGEIILDAAPKTVIAAYHRLVYAPPARRPHIHDEIKAGRLQAAADDVSEATTVQLSESRIEYPPHGGVITDLALTTPEGEAVQALQTGRRYRFRYRVDYMEPAHAPCYGMLIKTKRGVEIGGAVARAIAQEGRSLNAGQSVEVCFDFDCPLLPGYYFLNCGTTRRDGDEQHFVHRIVDALQFQVLAGDDMPDLEKAGMIDLKVEAGLKEHAAGWTGAAGSAMAQCSILKGA